MLWFSEFGRPKAKAACSAPAAEADAAGGCSAEAGVARRQLPVSERTRRGCCDRRPLEAPQHAERLMTIDFPYTGYKRIPPIDVPDHNLMAVLSPRLVPDADESAALRHGFDSPFGARR